MVQKQSDLCLSLKDKVQPWKQLALSLETCLGCTMTDPIPSVDSIKALFEEVCTLSVSMKAKLDMARDRLHATCVADILYHPQRHPDVPQALRKVSDFIKRGGGDIANLPRGVGKRFAAAITQPAASGQEAVAHQGAGVAATAAAASGQGTSVEKKEEKMKREKKMKKGEENEKRRGALRCSSSGLRPGHKR